MERRQYKRISARAGDVSHPNYTCIDFSEIGMRFSASHAVARGEMFSIELQTLTEPVKLLCRVVWCNEPDASTERRFQFGVTFEGYSMSKQRVVRELIYSRS
jgi:hypothetical protein